MEDSHHIANLHTQWNDEVWSTWPTQLCRKWPHHCLTVQSLDHLATPYTCPSWAEKGFLLWMHNWHHHSYHTSMLVGNSIGFMETYHNSLLYLHRWLDVIPECTNHGYLKQYPRAGWETWHVEGSWGIGQSWDHLRVQQIGQQCHGSTL